MGGKFAAEGSEEWGGKFESCVGSLRVARERRGKLRVGGKFESGKGSLRVGGEV